MSFEIMRLEEQKEKRIKKVWRRPTGFIVYHKKDPYTHYRNNKRERGEKAESLFQDIMAGSLPNLEHGLDIQVYEALMSPEGSTQRGLHKITI